MEIKKYWDNFLTENKLPSDTTYFESFYFGSNKSSAENLLNLVLDGKKIATSSAKEEYILNDEREPETGDFSIVTNFEGEPKCIIKTTSVTQLKFKDMTYDLCKLEGEDLTLKTWQEKHIEFFNIVGKHTGYKFKWDMIVVFEIFEVVYQ